DIVWEYHDSPPFNFFSPYISGARRLPNGNTLITEGNFGRIFQVTPEGEVVWEYISPYFDARPDGMVTNAVFRSTFYMAEELPLV
ncbi:MAG: aryl sulfotransferase, partial [Chloroflexi bacterium]|nr:aryl sulfotransferase [Chloroflexota bacterium]